MNSKQYFYQSRDIVNTEVDLDNPHHTALVAILLQSKPLPVAAMRKAMKLAGLSGPTRDVWLVDRDTATGLITHRY